MVTRGQAVPRSATWGNLVVMPTAKDAPPTRPPSFDFPAKSFTIQLDPTLVDRLEKDVIESFKSITKRGSEVGGLLLGALDGEAGAVFIADYELFECSYNRGPLFLLTDQEARRLEVAVRKRKGPDDPVVVGFFRSNTRKDLALDDDDLSILKDLFNGTNQVALLIKPFSMKPCTASFFVWDDGRMQEVAGAVSFPFRQSELTTLLGPPDAAKRDEAAQPVRLAPKRAEQATPSGLTPKPELPPEPPAARVEPPAARVEPPAAAEPPAATVEPPAVEVQPPVVESRPSPPVPAAYRREQIVPPRVVVQPHTPPAPPVASKPVEEAAAPSPSVRPVIRPVPPTPPAPARSEATPRSFLRERLAPPTPPAPPAAAKPAPPPPPPVTVRAEAPPRHAYPARPAPPVRPAAAPVVPPPKATAVEPPRKPVAPPPKAAAEPPQRPAPPPRRTVGVEPLQKPAAPPKPPSVEPVQKPAAPAASLPAKPQPESAPSVARAPEPPSAVAPPITAAPARTTPLPAPLAASAEKTDKADQTDNGSNDVRFLIAKARIAASTERTTHPEPEPEKGARTGRWIGLAVGAVALIAAGAIGGVYLSQRNTTPSATITAPGATVLSLSVERSGGQVRLSWNRDAAPIRTAQKAELTITDGGQQQVIRLDPSELRTGGFSYAPASAEVLFRLELTDTATGRVVSETVRSVSSRPSALGSPAPNAPPARATVAETAPAGRQPVPPSKAEPAAAAATPEEKPVSQSKLPDSPMPTEKPETAAPEGQN